MVSKRKGKQD